MNQLRRTNKAIMIVAWIAAVLLFLPIIIYLWRN